jgi:hypothetical protein
LHRYGLLVTVVVPSHILQTSSSSPPDLILSGTFAGCVEAARELGDQVIGDVSGTVVVRSVPGFLSPIWHAGGTAGDHTDRWCGAWRAAWLCSARLLLGEDQQPVTIMASHVGSVTYERR